MEYIGMTVIFLAIVGVLAYYGVFNVLERVSVMAEEEIAVTQIERKAENVKRVAKVSIDEKLVKEARDKIKSLDSVSLI